MQDLKAAIAAASNSSDKSAQPQSGTPSGNKIELTGRGTTQVPGLTRADGAKDRALRPLNANQAPPLPSPPPSKTYEDVDDDSMFWEAAAAAMPDSKTYVGERGDAGERGSDFGLPRERSQDWPSRPVGPSYAEEGLDPASFAPVTLADDGE